MLTNLTTPGFSFFFFLFKSKAWNIGFGVEWLATRKKRYEAIWKQQQTVPVSFDTEEILQSRNYAFASHFPRVLSSAPQKTHTNLVFFYYRGEKITPDYSNQWDPVGMKGLLPASWVLGNSQERNQVFTQNECSGERLYKLCWRQITPKGRKQPLLSKQSQKAVLKNFSGERWQLMSKYAV